MKTMQDFVSKIWANSRERLEDIDPIYVEKLQAQIRLDALGLSSSDPADASLQPSQRMTTNFHRLLEACAELVFQADILKACAECLRAEPYKKTTPEEAGKLACYHFRSWFIHARTLAERTNHLIDLTVGTHIEDSVTQKTIAKKHKDSVYEQISQVVSTQRNQYAHGTVRSWASGLTEDELWEGYLAVDLTPQKMLEEFYYPDEGHSIISGKHDRFVEVTGDINAIIGLILQNLYKDVFDYLRT